MGCDFNLFSYCATRGLEIRNDVFQTCDLCRKAYPRLLCGPVVLRLVLGPIEVFAHRFQFLQRDVDDAILAVRKEQRPLPCFDIPLDRSPPRRADAQCRAG